MRVGVLALQGDFEKHLSALRAIGANAAEVRMPDDLEFCERLIIPGGESTTLGILLQRHGLAELIIQRANSGMPIWGTCMGMILLAKRIKGPSQFSLELLDVEIERNAFGAQLFSFEQSISIVGQDEPMQAVFIRAPAVVSFGSNVKPIAVCRERVVAVREGRLLGTSFHPELTDDTRLHQMFLNL